MRVQLLASPEADVVTRREIRRAARLEVADCWEGGEVNLTLLAENTAHALGRDEWLDDPDHEVWEVAIEVAEEAGGIR